MTLRKQVKVLSDPGVFAIEQVASGILSEYTSTPNYQIIQIGNTGICSVDLQSYSFDGPVLFFTTPYQHFKIETTTPCTADVLSFHGDYYCIEYHKHEVACNGLLFNNIYNTPLISIGDPEISRIFECIRKENANATPYSDPVLRSYLQLILAIASKIKKTELQSGVLAGPHPMSQFRDLLERYFIQERTVGFYAEKLAVTPNVLTKKCRKYFGKSPSTLIQDRIILEAKKLLHLTYKSVKEIAAELHFEDEHYFSRYFKKNTGIAPTYFREKTGISVVAELSIR